MITRKMLPYGAHPALFLHNTPGRALLPFVHSLPLASLPHVPVHGGAQHIPAVFQTSALPLAEGVPRVLQELPPAAQKMLSGEEATKATNAKADRKAAANAADGESSVNLFAGVPNVNSFAKKLYHMVTTSSPSIVTFTPDGLSFEVKDPKKLERQVLPKYFRHSRFQSLVRQLNFYDFKKTSKERDEWIYTHSLFQRDRSDLLESIRRKPTSTVPKARPAPPPDSPPASPQGAMQYYPFNNASPARGGESSGGGSDHRCPPSPPTPTRTTSLRRGRRAVGRPRRVVQEYAPSTDDEEDEEAMLSSDDEREFMEVPGLGGRAYVQEEGEEEVEDGEGDEEVPLLLNMRRAFATPTVNAAVPGGVSEVVAPPRERQVVDLSPYCPTAEDVSLWEGVRQQWAQVVGGHGDDVLALSERLPLSHVDVCRFFLSTPPYSSGGQLWSSLCGLLQSCSGLVGPLQDHVDALHPHGGPRGKEGRQQQSGAALLALLKEGGAGLSAEAMCVLRALLADALNHLREAVASMDMDDVAQPALEGSLDLWMQHATRFF